MLGERVHSLPACHMGAEARPEVPLRGRSSQHLFLPEELPLLGIVAGCVYLHLFCVCLLGVDAIVCVCSVFACVVSGYVVFIVA